MHKVIVTLTDRAWYEEFDLRKKKLSKLDYVSFFAIEEETGEVISKASLYSFTSNENLEYTLKYVLENRMTKNVKSTSFFSNYISKEKYEEFIKFASRKGKVAEVNFDHIALILNHLKELEGDLREKMEKFMFSLKDLKLEDRNCRWRKINYKNILIKGRENYFISDDRTYITHVFQGYEFEDKKLITREIDYYSYWGLGGKDVKVSSLGKRGRKKFLDLAQKISDVNVERRKVLVKFIDSMFE